MVYAVLSLTIWFSTNQRGSNRLVVVKNMVEPYVIQPVARIRRRFREISTSSRCFDWKDRFKYVRSTCKRPRSTVKTHV